MVRPVLYLLAISVLIGCSGGRLLPISEPEDKSLFLRGLQQLEQGQAPPQAWQRLRMEHHESPWAGRADTIIAISEERADLQQRIDSAREALQDCLEQDKALQQKLEACNRHSSRLEQKNIRLEENLEKFKSLLIELEQREQQPL